MPSTTTFRRGQVVVVDVPFSNHTGTKPRPAMIVSAEAFHRDLPGIIVCPISSQPRYYNRPGPGDCPLAGWRAIGLRHPSTLRVSKLLAIDKRIIRRPLGTATQQDFARVEMGLRQAMASLKRECRPSEGNTRPWFPLDRTRTRPAHSPWET